jgi:fumarylacetoacetase
MTDPCAPAGQGPTTTSPLFASLVDDAGLFPPALLPMSAAVARHYADEDAGSPTLTHRFLCPAGRLDELRASATRPIRVGLILDVPDFPDIGDITGLTNIDVELVEVALPPGASIEALVDRLRPFRAGARIFVEVPPTGLHRVPEGVGLKVRCGGLTPELFPSTHELAVFIRGCVEHDTPFKATAGLHHAVRHPDPSLGVYRHGFLNLVLAVCAAIEGRDPARVLELMDQRELVALARAVTRETAQRARELLVSYGSCNTHTPIEGLRELGLVERHQRASAISEEEIVTSTWAPGADASPYSVANLPYGVFSRPGEPPRAGVRIGDHVLDLASVLHDEVFAAPSLNGFLARGRTAWRDTRRRIQCLLSADAKDASANRAATEPHLIPLDRVRLHMPIEIGDYVDFYCSLEHATNLGRMFRPDESPLKPSWRHLPVGYHGRSGTVVISGTPITRPRGQRASSPAGPPAVGPSAKLDIEAELGFVVGTPSRLGDSAGDFADHVFGVTLVNDWSARDIQAWEYVPLGPFLGKSFATSISAWITPLEALEHARIPGRAQNPEPVDYLRRREPWGLDLTLDVELDGESISSPPYRGMYWTPDQMLAHMTVNGASLRTGDLFASGTVSGPEPSQRGSLIEISWNGTEPIKLSDGRTRTFLEDGDTVTISATAPGPGGCRIALGEVTGTILPSSG